MSSSEQQQPQPRQQEEADPPPREEPVWQANNGDWTLTWPIWHMLPRQERKELALKHGYRTIGEFEEYMSLQRAVGDASTDNILPYDNALIYSAATTSDDTAGKEDAAAAEDQKPAAHKSGSGSSEHDDDDDDDDEKEDENSVNEQLEQDMEDEHARASDKLARDELYRRGGAILMLPEEALHKVFDFLPVDAYATLALVSPHWKSFTRTEAVYKRLCERLYLNQSQRRALHVSRFGNSYRLMLERRPRVKACGGLYVLKYAKVKRIDRNMWTEIPVGAVLELVYYRYLYFQEDGRVLYALTATPPHEMFPRLLQMCMTREPDKAAVWGSYCVQKTAVTVTARQEWQYVKLVLSIDTGNQLHGRNGCLTLDEHYTSKSGNFNGADWKSDRIKYDVPEEPFRFVKDKRL